MTNISLVLHLPTLLPLETDVLLSVSLNLTEKERSYVYVSWYCIFISLSNLFYFKKFVLNSRNVTLNMGISSSVDGLVWRTAGTQVSVAVFKLKGYIFCLFCMLVNSKELLVNHIQHSWKPCIYVTVNENL